MRFIPDGNCPHLPWPLVPPPDGESPGGLCLNRAFISSPPVPGSFTYYNLESDMGKVAHYPRLKENLVFRALAIYDAHCSLEYLMIAQYLPGDNQELTSPVHKLPPGVCDLFYDDRRTTQCTIQYSRKQALFVLHQIRLIFCNATRFLTKPIHSDMSVSACRLAADHVVIVGVVSHRCRESTLSQCGGVGRQRQLDVDRVPFINVS